jgi:5'-nucleotidase (lipoprotein e(P4) family)
MSRGAKESGKTRARYTRWVGGGRVALACGVCFLVGSLWNGAGVVPVLAQKELPVRVELPFAMKARTGANLYVQTSAEFRACCLQIYRCAETRLRSMCGSHEPGAPGPAVVMDLDETVFDNSAFQTFLYRNSLEYSDSLWARYEEQYPQDVTLIPGAKTFIEHAEEMGVTVIYLSNRVEAYSESTESALRSLGLNMHDISSRLYLKPDGGKSDKSARRNAAEERFHVVMYIGDNLRDFSEVFVGPKLDVNSTPQQVRNAIESRRRLVDANDQHWGVDWFIVPNPVYGEWERLVGPDPLAIMHPTRMGSRAGSAP